MSKENASKFLSEDHSRECNEEGNEVKVQEAISSLRALVSGEINVVLLHTAPCNITAFYKASTIPSLNLDTA